MLRGSKLTLRCKGNTTLPDSEDKEVMQKNQKKEGRED